MEMGATALGNQISSRDFFQWGIRKRMICGKPEVNQIDEKSVIRVDRRVIRVHKEASAVAANIIPSQEEQSHKVKSALDKKVMMPCNNNIHSSPPPLQRITRSQHPVSNIMCTRSSNNTNEVNQIQDNKALNLETFVWPKMCLTLSLSQIEEDFQAMKSLKLPLRPKKRLKCIQRAIQNVSPGGWLSDLSQERYEVKEKKCMKKRPRGLKAMRIIDSDSE